MLATFLTAKVVGTAIVSAGLAFAIGVFASRGRATAPVAVPVVAARVNDRDDALREESRQLKAELEQMRADVRRLEATNSKLPAKRVASSSPPNRGG